MSDLIKRLCESRSSWEDGLSVPTDLECEAADALEQLQEEHGDMNLANVKYEKRIEQLETALKHYANRKMWRTTVIDSYSGECYLFDWDGDLADEPYEIAEKVLECVPDGSNNDG